MAELNAKQSRAVAALLAGSTMTEAAKLAGVSRMTLTRWVKQPGFAAALRAGQGEIIGVVGPRFSALLNLALDSCALDLGNVNARGHRDARRLVLANWTRLDEHADLLARLDRLEQKSGLRNGSKK